MPDLAFSHPRLAALYDTLEGERSDLEFYATLVDRYGARKVLDVGCGTGTFACLLARGGVEVIGMDPAQASLEAARQKSEAHKVRWIVGDVTSMPPLGVDMVTMTGNVAQVFLTDDDWLGALECIRRALRPEGLVVFESRDPAREAWRSWNRAQSYRRIEIAGCGLVTTWCEVTKVDGPLVDFRWTFEFEADDAVIVSNSTLRFRTRAEIEQSLARAGYSVAEVLDAPDRPGRELVFVARRSPSMRTVP
jgi:ubiquinone/menaquinone biosynthesis C-methylase UbiE